MADALLVQSLASHPVGVALPRVKLSRHNLATAAAASTDDRIQLLPNSKFLYKLESLKVWIF